ncbi:putative serine protease K12H4.7 [Grifola frondosa]|uniref:Putative serine protease K12H4.7 n=1 Tax=Grifola frondosa TaxID=5627 RepID=A0A1C7LT15_GRIFR|nr:putative serine protease K12H4.7 [Grifola frondosa]
MEEASRGRHILLFPGGSSRSVGIACRPLSYSGRLGARHRAHLAQVTVRFFSGILKLWTPGQELVVTDRSGLRQPVGAEREPIPSASSSPDVLNCVLSSRILLVMALLWKIGSVVLLACWRKPLLAMADPNFLRRLSIPKPEQRFWHTYEFYEPGGPIILFTPGETNANGYEGFLINTTINGQFAQELNGSTIVIEHRFFGFSNPLPDLSVKSLQLHTIQQAIDDLEYFAKNVQLPMPGGSEVAPASLWSTSISKPGLFQAAYASSAVVESIVDYWVTSIRPSCPGIRRRSTLSRHSSTCQTCPLDDFAGSLRNNLWDWQSLQPYSGPSALFFKFCDALEVKNGVSAGPDGWGVEHALQAWGSYWTNTYYELHDDAEDCLGSYDLLNRIGPTSLSITRIDRGIGLCATKLDFSKRVRLSPSYPCNSACTVSLTSLSHLPVPNVAKTNQAYDGWNVHATRLFFANGHRDPWREATLAADGTNFTSTALQPLAIGDGFHCSDLFTRSAVDPTVQAVQREALQVMSGWIASWKLSA